MKTKGKELTSEESENFDLGIILAKIFPSQSNASTDDWVKEFIHQVGKDRSFTRKVASKELNLPGFPKLRFLEDGKVKVGGGGIVFHCEHAGVPGLQYALKITRPSLLADESGASQYHATVAEYVKHAPLAHQNVARVIFGEPLNVKPDLRGHTIYECPTMLMEWIDGAEPLASYLKNSVKNYVALADLLAQCFDGLNYLHRNDLIHWDIKSDNILVDKHGVVKISDLGNSERLSKPKPKVQSSRWNLPPILQEAIPIDPIVRVTNRRVNVILPDIAWNNPMTDMWMLAKELDRYLAEKLEDYTADEEVVPKYKVFEAKAFQEGCFPKGDMNAKFALSFFRLIIDRLLLPRTPQSPHIYLSASEVARDIRKLVPEFGAAQNVPELQAIPQNVLRLPHSGNCPYTERMSKLYNSSLIRRLSQHLQLATLAHVYPGARHCRSEHAAGVMATTAQYVRALYADRTNPFWRLSVEREDIDALLVAALLHDVGHISLGHFLEEMTDVFEGRMHEDYFTLLLAPDRQDETAFGTRIRVTIDNDRKQLKAILVNQWHIPANRVDEFLSSVATILRPPPAMNNGAVRNKKAKLLPNEAHELKIQILHSIIDSAIDADKLDYLVRDAHHAGVQYAKGIDFDRFFQALTTISNVPNHDETAGAVGACIGVTGKGILPVEYSPGALSNVLIGLLAPHCARRDGHATVRDTTIPERRRKRNWLQHETRRTYREISRF